MKTKSNLVRSLGVALMAALFFLAPAARAQGYAMISNLVFGTYLDTNGVTQNLKLDLYMQTNTPSPKPVVVWIFGGAWLAGGRVLFPQTSPDVLGLPSRGYVVAAIDYRLSGVAKWPAQIQDVRGAIRWLRANAATYGLDTNRFGVWGVSSGGHLADLLALCDAPSSTVGGTTVDMVGSIGGNPNFSDRVQAVCSEYNATDFSRMDNYATTNPPDHDAITSPESMLLGAQLQTVPELAATANPLIYIKPTAPPFLLIHGTIDGSVTFNQSEIFNAALVRAGVDSTFFPNFNANHAQPPSSWTNANLVNGIYKFFDRTLKGINTNPPPVPVLTCSATNGTMPFSVTFNASGSYDTNGTILQYAWSFGDDTGAGNVSSVTHTYTNPGVFTVTLCVEDNGFAMRSLTTNIYVNPSLKFPTTNTFPQIAITAPQPNAVQLAPGAVVLQAAVTPGNGVVTNVIFQLDGKNVGQDYVAPYAVSVGQLAAGHHTAQALVMDMNGLVTNSPAVGFDVLPNQFTPLVVTNAGQNYFAVQFYRVPAATNFTYAVDASADLLNWSNGVTYTYSGNILSNANCVEFSRIGTNLETIIVRDAAPMTSKKFLRVKATVP